MLPAPAPAASGSGEAGDFLGDRGQPGLRGGDDPVPVLVRFLVSDDRPHVGGIGEFLHRGHGLGEVELVEVLDRQLARCRDTGGGAGADRTQGVGYTLGALLRVTFSAVSSAASRLAVSILTATSPACAPRLGSSR
jgi:hypothetical protein